MRHLAIDLGARRVGLAVSDAGGEYASPLCVLTVTSPEDAARQVLKVVAEERPERLVVGCPIDMSGRIDKPARTACRWAAGLSEAAGVPAVMVDERLSSFAAEQQLVGRKRAGEKMTRGQKKKQLDALAAAEFLAEHLRGDLPGLDPAAVLAGDA